MIKPTVGRVVWYYKDGAAQMSAGQPCAAQIAYVHSDTCINIGYLDENGNHHNATSVRLLEDREPVAESMHFPFCTWMPYQVGQAAKTDEAEAALQTAKAARALGEGPY